jgi:hypothetical protein
MANQLSTKINHECFISNQTPESAYILGLLWADGYVSKTTNSINIQCLKEDIDYFYPIFQTTGKYNIYYKKQSLNNKMSGTINCSSSHLHSFLKENDYFTKSISSHSKILSTLPQNLHSYFLLGLSDGDGCFYINMKHHLFQWTITSTYEQEWNSIEEIFSKLNLKYRINRVKNGNGGYSQFQINGPQNLLKLGEFLYSGELGLKRKRDKFENIKTYLEEKSYKILCYDKQYNLVSEFDSLAEASRWVGKPRNVSSDIRDACLGKQSTAFGYIWKKIKSE